MAQRFHALNALRGGFVSKAADRMDLETKVEDRICDQEGVGATPQWFRDMNQLVKDLEAAGE